MEYEFPATQTTSWYVVVVHFVLLTLALGSVVGVFWRVKRPASKLDLAAWAVVAVAAIVLRAIGVSFAGPIELPFLQGFFLFALGVALLAFAVTLVRVLQGKSASSIALVFGSLLLLGLAILCLLPSVPSAREAARRMQCAQNLKQIGLAFHNQYDAASAPIAAAAPWPSDAGDEATTAAGPPVSWRVALLPYLERADLFQQYDKTQAWDAPANRPLAKTRVADYLCPAQLRGTGRKAEGDLDDWYTAYLALTGPGTYFPDGRRSEFSPSRASLGQSIIVVEACGTQVAWTEPRDIDVRRNSINVNQGSDQRHRSPSILSSYHPGGAQCLMADGSVRYIDKRIDPQVLRDLTRAPTPEAARD